MSPIAVPRAISRPSISNTLYEADAAVVWIVTSDCAGLGVTLMIVNGEPVRM